MGKRLCGTFNGTGAAVYLCVGFIPDWVRIRPIETTAKAMVEWSRRMRSADCIDGIIDNGGASFVSRTLLTTGNGIQPYFGGELLTSANQTSTGYGEGVFLGRDDTDMRVSTAKGGDASSATLTKWNRGVAAGKGYWDAAVAGTKVGEGSKIIIDGKEYVVLSLTSGGSSASQVTLDKTVASGAIEFIGGMYDFAPIAIGQLTPPGFKVNLTSVVNVNDEIQMFECGTYDDGK